MNITTLTMAREVARLLLLRKEKVVFAESCTAGLVCASLAQVPGVSECLCGSLVTYRRETKEAWLHVSNQTIVKHTCESMEVAEEMVKGAFEQCVEADWAVSIVGHFGPNAPEDKDGKIYVCIAHWQPAIGPPMYIDPECEIRERITHVIHAHKNTGNPELDAHLIRTRRQRDAVEFVLSHLARCLTKESIPPEKIRLHSDFTSKYRDDLPPIENVNEQDADLAKYEQENMSKMRDD